MKNPTDATFLAPLVPDRGTEKASMAGPFPVVEMVEQLVTNRAAIYRGDGHRFAGGLSDDRVIFYGLRPDDGACCVVAASDRMNVASLTLLDGAKSGRHERWDDATLLVAQMRASELVAYMSSLARMASDVVPALRDKATGAMMLDEAELFDGGFVLFIGRSLADNTVHFVSDTVQLAELGDEFQVLCSLFAEICLARFRTALS